MYNFESISKIYAFDSETLLFRAGMMAPPMVCGSTANVTNGGGSLSIEGTLLPNGDNALTVFRHMLQNGYTVSFANAAYDLLVAAEADPTLLALIRRAIREGRVHDILISEALHAIFYGHLGYNADGSELRNSKNEVTNRYSLDVVTRLVLGRDDAKKNDAWRRSYALLWGIPPERWPEEPRIYPVDDARNTLEDTIGQRFGRIGSHSWIEAIPAIPDIAPATYRCSHCGVQFEPSLRIALCANAPREASKNLGNLPAQVEADVCLKLGAAHSFRTDPSRVEKLAAEVEEKHKVAVDRFMKKGWIRSEGPKAGTKDTAAVKRAVATAYGATGVCKRCNGTGKIRNYKDEPCRGEKIKGRFRGCAGDGCAVCSGTRTIEKAGNEVGCRNVFDENDALIEAGCDGTGFDLTTAPMLPRSPKDGVKTDRDALMESGDEDLSDYGENEFEKSRSTYVPYLRKGVNAPLFFSPNVIVATGRCSYEDSPLHQMPRSGGERKCVRARGQWCGYPIELILGSTDYEAGELCTLSQYCYWLFDYSQMREAINKSGKPGILHSDLAAEVLGVSLDEFLKRLKAKDKQAVDFRQMCKPINFGVPGRMGVPKLVLTSRKKNAGFTVCEGGPAVNEKGQPGYWGVRFCTLTGGAKQCGVHKVLEWKRYPCAPVCRECCRVVEEMLKPAYFRRYPEIKDYFKWAERMIEAGKPAPCMVWDPETNKPIVIRERGGCEITEFCNNGFQGMLADIGKDAYCAATWECYLGVKEDGSPSPLAGCRLPLYLHDEPLSELILATAHLSGPRIAEIMMASGRRLAPDLTWKAETAIAFWWDKSMEPVYSQDDEKRLLPWGPIPDEHRDRFPILKAA